MSASRNISICGVPHSVTIAEGGVVFSDKSGFYGVSGRYMFELKSTLWYLVHSSSTFGHVPAAHLDRMHEYLKNNIDQKTMSFKDE